MEINLAELSSGQVYHLMTQTIVPRPIAWVLSDNGRGAGATRYNLAPFSYFNAICSDPPLVMISIGKKPDGSPKDTRHNIEVRKQFVIHLPHAQQASLVTETSRTLPHGISELAMAEQDAEDSALKLVPFGDFALPRLADSHVALACELYELKEIGSTPQAMIIGETKSVYLSDAVGSVNAQQRIQVDPRALDPLARLGGNDYVTFGEIVTVARPK